MASKDLCDVVIIGGGPAGISAAIWCVELGLKCTLIERETELGGQLLWTHTPITNYPGVESKNGRELRDQFVQAIENKEIRPVLGTAVARVDLASKRLVLDDGREFSTRAIIIAMGVRRRRLGVPGEFELKDRGVLRSGALDREKVAGRSVVIIGGGDAALENALMLGETAVRVFIVHRRNEFAARKEFVEQVTERLNIDIVPNARATAIIGNASVTGVLIENIRTGAASQLDADAVLIRIGVEPNSNLFAGQLKLDNLGYILVDPVGRTSAPDVYAIGDIANPVSPTIATAVGTGATAAKVIARG